MNPVDEKLVNLDVLNSWMDSQGLPSGEIVNQELLTGGTQNILLYFERGGEEYVLRRPPAHLRSSSNEAMRREATILGAIADTGVPHPRLLASCPDESVMGAVFYLMEPIKGFNPTIGLPEYHKSDPAIRRRMGESLVEALCLLGEVDYKSAGLENFGKPEGYLQRQAGRWSSQLKSYEELDGYENQDLPYNEDITRWMQDNLPEPGSPGILHGDCHLANTMFSFDSPELAALVDWELSTVGDPLVDLGWLMATWPEDDGTTVAGLMIEPWEGFLTIGELVSHYREHSSRNLDHIQWYAVLACYKLGVILEGTYARACAGKAPMEVGEMLHQATIGLYQRAWRWAREGVPV